MHNQREILKSSDGQNTSRAFDVEKFKLHLHTRWLGSRFIYVEKTSSTNTLLKEQPSESLVHGTVLLTDNQPGGKGQYKRKWESEPGKNLTFTMAMKPPDTSQLPYLTLVTAWAVIRTLTNEFGDGFNVKWPNDLIHNGRKIGGLLTESVFNGQHLDRVIIGIGLNVHQTLFSDDIAGSATSLALVSDVKPERELLLAKILEEIEQGYQRWYANEKELLTKVNQSLIGYGKWVMITVNGERDSEEVKFLGVNEKGQLVILTQELEVKTFSYEQIRIEPGV